MHYIHIGLAPKYFSDCVSTVSAASGRYRLRSTGSAAYVLPRTRTKFRERGFFYSGPTAWNTLPSNLHDITDTSTFRKWFKNVKNILFDRAYNPLLLVLLDESYSSALQISHWLIDWLVDWFFVLTFDLLTSTCNRFSLSTSASQCKFGETRNQFVRYRVQKLLVYDHALTHLLQQGEERSRWLWIHLGCVQMSVSRSPTQGRCWWPLVYWWVSVVLSAFLRSSSTTHTVVGLVSQLTAYRSVKGEPGGTYGSLTTLLGWAIIVLSQSTTAMCIFHISSIWHSWVPAGRCTGVHVHPMDSNLKFFCNIVLLQ